MSRFAVRVFVGFAVGGVIPALGVLIWDALGVTGVAVFAVPLVTYALSGAIGGASLRRGRRPVIGFGVGFVLLAIFVPAALVAPQGMSKDSQVFIGSTLFFLIGFGLAGGIGAAVSGLGWRMALAGAGAFGLAGAIGGAVFAIVFFVIERIPHDLRGGILLGAISVVLLIPHGLGGALFAVALEYPSRKRKKLGLCLKCGYDLRATTDRCPECGTPIASISQQQ